MIAHNNTSYSINELIGLITESVNSGKRVKIGVTGMSMFPLFKNGRDFVVLEHANCVHKYDIVLHKRESGQYILHRIIKKKGDLLTIAGDFEIQKEYPVNTSQVIARVTGFVRKGKECSCQNPFYRLYSVFWVVVFPVRYILLEFAIRLRRLLHGKD